MSKQESNFGLIKYRWTQCNILVGGGFGLGSFIECFHCGHTWLFASVAGNKCPQCSSVVELYSSQIEANKVAEVYNEGLCCSLSGLRPLTGGFWVCCVIS